MRRILWSCVGSLIGIGLCAYISEVFFEPRDSVFLIGSFGASAVLLFAAQDSPLAQPRNLVGGHLVSALAGVIAYQALGSTWVAAAVAVSSAIGSMSLTRTIHPPGGATALIAVTGGDRIHDLGWAYPFVPVTAGAVLLLAVAVVMSAVSRDVRYPRDWW